MSNITREDLLKAGVQHGHQAKKWHPAFKQYVFMKKNGMHVINLDKTIQCLKRAEAALIEILKSGQKILFVGRKKQVKDLVEKVAERLGQLYITERWLGGTLTNFTTIKKLLRKYVTTQQKIQDPSFGHLTKKERLIMERENKKRGVFLKGIVDLKRLPGAVFVTDVKKESTAIKEAHKLGIPVFGILDSNADPSLVNFPIPANDDKSSSVECIINHLEATLQDAVKVGNSVGEKGEINNKKPTKVATKETKSPAKKGSVATKEAPKKENNEKKVAPAKKAPAVAKEKEAKSTKKTSVKSTKEVAKVSPSKVAKATTKTMDVDGRVKAKSIIDGGASRVKKSEGVDAKLVMKMKQKTSLSILKCKKALAEAGGDMDKAIELLRKQDAKFAAKRLGRDMKEGTVFAKTNKENTVGLAFVLNCETDFVAKNDMFVQFGKDLLAIALEKKVAAQEELLKLPYKQTTFQEEITHLIGVLGENISLAEYQVIEGKLVSAYVHIGSKLGAVVALKTDKINEDTIQLAKNIAIQVVVSDSSAIDKDGVDPALIAKEKEVVLAQLADEKKPANILEKIVQGRLDKFIAANTLLEQPFALDNTQLVKDYIKSIGKDISITKFKRVQAGS